MGAFLQNGTLQDRKAALEHYGWAMEVIKRGQQIWHGVPKEVRGVVFENSFLRAVKALHLEVSMQACNLI